MDDKNLINLVATLKAVECSDSLLELTTAIRNTQNYLLECSMFEDIRKCLIERLEREIMDYLKSNI